MKQYLVKKSGNTAYGIYFINSNSTKTSNSTFTSITRALDAFYNQPIIGQAGENILVNKGANSLMVFASGDYDKDIHKGSWAYVVDGINYQKFDSGEYHSKTGNKLKSHLYALISALKSISNYRDSNIYVNNCNQIINRICNRHVIKNELEKRLANVAKLFNNIVFEPSKIKSGNVFVKQLSYARLHKNRNVTNYKNNHKIRWMYSQSDIDDHANKINRIDTAEKKSIHSITSKGYASNKDKSHGKIKSTEHHVKYALEQKFLRNNAIDAIANAIIFLVVVAIFILIVYFVMLKK